MSEAIITQLNQALDTLYGNSDPQIKDQANDFLMNFQRSEEAWQIIFPVLGDENSSLQLKIFTAQTFRSKVQYDFSQLPKDSLLSLKDSLIQLMIAYNDKQKLITTQLCISLSNFALQYLEWDNAVTEIVSILSPSSLNTLLEFLKILPQELMDVKKTPLTDEEFETRATQLLHNNVEQVLYILTSISDAKATNSKETNELVLSCIESWIIEIPVNQILNNASICSLIFEGILNDDTFEMAITCLSTIISETAEDVDLEIIKALYDQLINLKPLIAESQDDPEKMERFSQLFATAGETWHVYIAKSPYDFKTLVEIMLQLTAYDEDLDIVRYTFKFWYDLKNLLISSARQEARQCFTPIYAELVEVMDKHLRYPLTSTSTNLIELFDNDKEAIDKFKEFRYEMGDVLKDCCAVIGAPAALNIPFTRLQNFMNLQSQGQPVAWQEVEAPLFSIRAMAKEVGTGENTILPQIMRYLIQLPENPKIRYAATLVLGRYTEWAAKHPEFLEEQLNYITTGFQQQNVDMDIIIAAAHSLKYFCIDCGSLLGNYLEQLYNFYNNVQSALDIQSLYDITEGIAHILKEERDDEKLYNITVMFWKSTLDKLSQFVDITPVTGSQLDEVNTTIADNLEIISIYVDALKPRSLSNKENPVAKILMESVWPLVMKLIATYGRSVKVSERCMKLVRKSIQTFKQYLIPVLSTTAEMLVYGFQHYQSGCYLWVSGAFIKEYSSMEEIPPQIKSAVWSFSVQQIGTFISAFNALSEESLPDYTNLVEDFFRMTDDILMFTPIELLQADEMIQPIFETAIKSLSIYYEYESITAILQFLIDFYSWGFETPPISFMDDIPENLKFKILNFAMNTGEQLISKLMYGLIYSFPSDCWPDTNELIVKLIKLSTLEGSSKLSLGWLDKFLSSLPQGSVNEKERLKLLSTVEIAINSKDYRRVRSSIRDFANWYRRKNVDRQR
ncbi:hypothetical protein CANARDRAFT_26802 [[Candida] arabinofermentans NRRL YB-2248]|uniref:Importin N-terminal domain-containing protein n=1 Tax=[Candida] arabinofermentans NRRL YB-2248 TaxID=983967 RepID=A0A1E4T6P1_9ASCO|nr:hypothetical protein CANARDRAFT_26802 [[Candida] arabinofermentans NRRL YB-2248]